MVEIYAGMCNEGIRLAKHINRAYANTPGKKSEKVENGTASTLFDKHVKKTCAQCRKAIEMQLPLQTSEETAGVSESDTSNHPMRRKYDREGDEFMVEHKTRSASIATLQEKLGTDNVGLPEQAGEEYAFMDPKGEALYASRRVIDANSMAECVKEPSMKKLKGMIANAFGKKRTKRVGSNGSERPSDIDLVEKFFNSLTTGPERSPA